MGVLLARLTSGNHDTFWLPLEGEVGFTDMLRIMRTLRANTNNIHWDVAGIGPLWKFRLSNENAEIIYKLTA